MNNFIHSYLSIDSGNKQLDWEYKQIASQLIKIPNEHGRLKFMANFNELCEKYKAYKEFLKHRIRYDINDFIEFVSEHYPNNSMYQRRVENVKPLLTTWRNEMNFEGLNRDAHLWNQACYELFQYLNKNYRQSTKSRYTHFWYFLKDLDGKKYAFRASRENYQMYVLDRYGERITNWKLIPTFHEKIKPQLNELRIMFESN